jgi:hypothetical protein
VAERVATWRLHPASSICDVSGRRHMETLLTLRISKPQR